MPSTMQTGPGMLRAAVEAQFGYPAMRALVRSDDLREGPLAFAQKRALLWKGR
jgi:acetyl-CoA C-acetyltransferase